MCHTFHIRYYESSIARNLTLFWLEWEIELIYIAPVTNVQSSMHVKYNKGYMKWLIWYVTMRCSLSTSFIFENMTIKERIWICFYDTFICWELHVEAGLCRRVLTHILQHRVNALFTLIGWFLSHFHIERAKMCVLYW